MDRELSRAFLMHKDHVVSDITFDSFGKIVRLRRNLAESSHISLGGQMKDMKFLKSKSMTLKKKHILQLYSSKTIKTKSSKSIQGRLMQQLLQLELMLRFLLMQKSYQQVLFQLTAQKMLKKPKNLKHLYKILNRPILLNL